MNKYQSFLEDIENNIKNKEDLEYVKQRFEEFQHGCSDKKEKLEELEQRIEELESSMKTVKKEMYLGEDEDKVVEEVDTDYQFEVACPFCNTEFFADISEETKAITCPSCKKEIELDWSDDFEDFGGCGGCGSSCGTCGGCGIEDDM